MTGNRCDRGPGLADQRAVLATARAVLAGDQAAAHDSAGNGDCSACTVVCALQLGFMLAAGLAGQEYVTEDLHGRILALLEPAQEILDASPD